MVRGGRVLGRKGWVVDRVEELDRPELVASFVRQLYMERDEVPPRVLVPSRPADREVLEAWLGERRGTKVSIGVPERGAKRRLTRWSRSNAARVLPSAQAAAGIRLRSPLAGADGARRPARPRAGPAAHRVLRHLEPRPHRHGRLDGRLRGRTARSAPTTGDSRSRVSPDRTISLPWRRCSAVGSPACSKSGPSRPRPDGGGSPIHPRWWWSTVDGAS